MAVACRPTMRTSVRCLFLSLACLGMGGTNAEATPVVIYQSATVGQAAQTGGSAVQPTQFLGVRFELLAEATTTDVGGLFDFSLFSAGVLGHGSAEIFGAIVALAGPTDFPDSPDLST